MSKPQWKNVNIYLADKEKQKIRDVEFEPADLVSAVQAFCMAGYKVGFSFDFANDSYIVSVTGKEKSGDDWNKTFNGRHRTFDITASILIHMLDKASDGATLSHLFDPYHKADW